MAQYPRLETLNQMVNTGLVPVFYHPDLETAKQIVHACLDAGIRTIEFTNRGDNAYKVFSELVGYFAKEAPQAILGVGSINEPYAAALFIASGANFVVGPNFNPEVARICNRRKIPYSPGCGTASEISAAEEMGVEIVKLFPGDLVGGPRFVKSILGPMPWVRIMPTGGVEATPESIGEWFGAGVAAVGIGSNLVRKEWLKASEYAKITALARSVLGWIRAARSKSNILGLDHFCVYPASAGDAVATAEWYQQTFGLPAVENETDYFVGSDKGAKMEISRVQSGLPVHVAVRVADFEQAYQDLVQKGIEMEEPFDKKGSRLAFLKGTDPAGQRVHIVCKND